MYTQSPAYQERDTGFGQIFNVLASLVSILTISPGLTCITTFSNIACQNRQLFSFRRRKNALYIDPLTVFLEPLRSKDLKRRRSTTYATVSSWLLDASLT